MRRTASLLTALALTALTPAFAQIERVDVDKSAFSLGTLTPAEGAMPSTLWAGSERNAVEDLLITVPVSYDEPLHRELLRRVLLSPGEGPKGADNDLAGQKLIKAAKAGYYRDAADLAALVPGTSTEPALSEVIAYSELMDGKIDQACARGEGLKQGRSEPFWIKLRYICYVRADEDSAADLTLNLLRRQDALTAEQEDRFVAFAGGDPVALPDGSFSVFDWAMARASGFTLGTDILDRNDPGLFAALARSTDMPADLRAEALLAALADRTIKTAEAVNMLDALGTTDLASDYLTLTSVPPGSLDHAEALGRALGRDGADYRRFEGRARLFADHVADAEPVSNFAPYATEIALAAMSLGENDVAETWISALAADQTRPSGNARARRLVDILGLLDPEAARRVGAYIGMVEEPSEPAHTVTFNTTPTVPVVRLVTAALPAAEAEGQGPVALVYLTGLATQDDGQGGIREAVVTWARDRSSLGWLDRQIAFRAEATALLGEPAPEVVTAPPAPPAQPAGN